ncbi:MAG TPA: chloride channel protein [Humisphaera sp.]|nr:chloride channel protein [Humisphaera sp.]
MTDLPHHVERAATTGGLPVSPSMGPALEQADMSADRLLVDRRVILVSVLSILLALAAAVIAQILLWLIQVITNFSFHHTLSAAFHAPVDRGADPGISVFYVPVIGALIVGFMARYGSAGIRGHGIPEAMEKVLKGESRIPPRLTFLKPLSAAIAIGTGGPFGAEGPIIATGGALGSLIGQIIHTTAIERKTLLAAGAAAGMAATFGAPVSATLLAIELLLFEFRPRTFLPVALAAYVAAGARFAFHQPYPLFEMPTIGMPTQAAVWAYIVIGAIIGVASVFVTRAVYWIEDLFDLLPIHWMWWPAIGAVAVGVVGHYAPRTLGVGYDNIKDLISGTEAVKVMVFLCALKFISWSIALGSGTSGGTLAPLFTIGSAMGGLLGIAVNHLIPGGHVDVRVAALVGMAALFAGASRAMLTSVVFAFETTLQPYGLIPLLGGCAASYFVSCLLMRDTIMTAKITRKGVRVPAEYAADFLDSMLVEQVASKNLITLTADQTVGEVQDWIAAGGPDAHHQGYPILAKDGALLGVLTRRVLLNPAHSTALKVGDLLTLPPLTIYPDNTLREAADEMVTRNIGRLAVVSREQSQRLVGILTRSDVLSAHRRRLDETRVAAPVIRLSKRRAAIAET